MKILKDLIVPRLAVAINLVLAALTGYVLFDVMAAVILGAGGRKGVARGAVLKETASHGH